VKCLSVNQNDVAVNLRDEYKILSHTPRVSYSHGVSLVLVSVQVYK
jgi:hypothetical protein